MNSNEGMRQQSCSRTGTHCDLPAFDTVSSGLAWPSSHFLPTVILLNCCSHMLALIPRTVWARDPSWDPNTLPKTSSSSPHILCSFSCYRFSIPSLITCFMSLCSLTRRRVTKAERDMILGMRGIKLRTVNRGRLK